MEAVSLSHTGFSLPLHRYAIFCFFIIFFRRTVCLQVYVFLIDAILLDQMFRLP